MSRYRRLLLLLCAVCVLPGAAAQLQAQARDAAARDTSPTLILTGGKVFTADTTRSWAEAVAIRGERIAAVGSTAAIRRLAGHRTREIALAGRVVIPGINDAHDHLGDAGLGPEFRTGPSPTPDPTASQVMDSLRALAARTPAHTWLRTRIGLRVLTDSSVDRAALDRVAPDHPVMLHGWWGHGTLLNSAALRALGIDDGVVDPFGGWYGRDASGRLTGRLDEYAAWDAQRRLGALQSDSTLVADLRAFADSSLRFGVTSVQDMAGSFPPMQTLRVFRAAHLPIRVRLIRWSIPTATSLNTAEWDTVPRRVSPRVVVDGRKWVIEGTPIEQFALRRASYPGRPGWHGRLSFPLDSVRAMLADALRPGAAQLHLHVVGDSTAGLVLDAMESLAPDSAWRARRVRFEHGGMLSGPDVVRAARKGIAIGQPRGAAPYRSWRAAGIEVGYGSDMLRNPFVNLMGPVTGAGHADEAVSREEAVRIYTRGSAYLERAEQEKGTLAPGMLADLAVLSQDIFTVRPASLPATRSVLTIVGGEVVYDALVTRNGRRAAATPRASTLLRARAVPGRASLFLLPR
jgi:predicted amidohydrolase YtcJ